MKKSFLLLSAALLVLALATVSSADGKGKRFQNQAPQACTLVLTAPSFFVEGTVSAVSTPDAQEGITVSATTGNVTLYGLGPVRYWEGLGIDRPVVGDAVRIEAKSVTMNDVAINIIVSLAYEDGSAIQLRDAETGCPLWRGSGRRTEAGSN